MMKSMKKIFQYIVIFFGILCICMICLYTTCLIPSSKLKNNMMESLNEVKNNGSKKIVNIFNKKIIFDTYADAMMMNTAYSIDSKHPFYSMLFARSNYVDGVTDKTFPDEAYKQNKIAIFPHTNDLEKVVMGEKLDAIEYARYWHGYLVYLRPLLTVFNYMEIKIVSFIIHYILIAVLLYQIKKKLGMKYLIAVVFGVIVTEGYLVYLCLEETIGFSLILVESIILLSTNNKKYNNYFFIIGMITAFFDLFTIPVAIFAFPLILCMLLYKEKDIKLLIKDCFRYCLLFSIGYVAMWTTKWIIVDAVYERELIKNAICQALYRIDSLNVKFWQVQSLNITFIGLPVAIYTGAIYVVNIIVTIYEKIKFKKVDPIFCLNLLLGIIGVTPMLWYTFIREHSAGHAYFTYRNLLVTCICSQIMMIHILDKKIKKNRKEIFTIYVLINAIVIILNYTIK
ncbi:MAG: hypothetical protein Q4D02_02775 [Clostridia bacterium]|nr:hypothetical protein [Clostridia bacterium]